MADNELLIKINADVKNVAAAFDKVKAQTEDLEGSLGKLAKISGVAFAALTAQVFISVKEFGEAQAASRDLTNALQNQGIYTDQLKNSYKGYADEIEKTTGIQADEITKAQAVAQGFLGQIPITQDLTKAIADLSVQQGISLPAAAEELGKAIGNGTGQLLRMGIQFSSTDTEASRYQKTLDFVNLKAGGFAATANQGIGSLKGLETAIKNSQQELGARFAPAVETVIKALTNFLTPSKDATGLMVDFKAALIVTGLAITGIATVLPVLATGFLAVRAAVIAMNIQLTATKVLLAGLGIGLVILAVTELALHWETATQRIKVVVQGLVEFVSGAFQGLATVINGALHLDTAKMEAGWKQIQNAVKDGTATAFQTINTETKKGLTEQEAAKKVFADRENKILRDAEKLKIALVKAENEAVILQLTNASQAQIDLKKKEIDTLKALTDKKNGREKTLLLQHLAQIRQLEVKQVAEDKLRTEQFAQYQISAQAQLNQQKIGLDTALDDTQKQALTARIKTASDIKKDAYAAELQLEIDTHNTFLAEQNKYGTAYAAINQAMHSSIYQGSKQAFGELGQLTQSSNSTLKTIGKVAAVANIVIKTAESAMNIFEGFSVIPFVGPALGIAGAAAAVAFGGEQISKVQGARAGGFVEGVGFGDKIPFMLEPGELVTPRKNFDEVINSVAQSRTQKPSHTQSGGVLEIRLKDKLMDFIETKIVERKNLNISIQGA